MFFLEFPCFLHDSVNVGHFISGSSAFLNPACTSESSQFTYCLSLTWRILSITLLACEISTIVWEFEHSLALPIFGIGMKTDLFQSCGHCRVFRSCWHIECSTLTTSSFRIWNSSAGIPSLPVILFAVMLPKVRLFTRVLSVVSLNRQADWNGWRNVAITHREISFERLAI